jgi:hypothetical protein
MHEARDVQAMGESVLNKLAPEIETWRYADRAANHARKMRLIGTTGRQRNLNWFLAGLQEVARPDNTKLYLISMGRQAELPAEKTKEVKRTPLRSLAEGETFRQGSTEFSDLPKYFRAATWRNAPHPDGSSERKKED